jgi:ketosteroid isomerase-like protein
MEGVDDLPKAHGALMERFWRALTRGDREGLASLFTEDAVWHFPPFYRRKQGVEDARGRSEITDVFTRTPAQFYQQGTLRMERQFLVADEAHAAIQFEMHCKTVKGDDYQNRYVFTFRILDGRIAEGWEHLDSAYFNLQMRDRG